MASGRFVCVCVCGGGGGGGGGEHVPLLPTPGSGPEDGNRQSTWNTWQNCVYFYIYSEKEKAPRGMKIYYSVIKRQAIIMFKNVDFLFPDCT